MLRESLVFFILLGSESRLLLCSRSRQRHGLRILTTISLWAVMAVGFVQSLLALDAADGVVQDSVLVVNILLQALLGSPDFDSPKEKFGPPFGLIIYYAWSFMALVILLNILIALFNTVRALHLRLALAFD